MNRKLPSYFRLTFWNIIAFAIIALGLFATYRRFALGLGETSNTNDAVPWGLMIGFNILTGVGFAAGSLALSVVVEIFGLKKYKPLVKPMILTALVVEIGVVMTLLLDLGKPWNMVNLLISLNTNSVLFFVGWTVMLYLTVMVLELSPMVLERFKLERYARLIKSVTILLVVASAILSTMHQALLGALFLIMPGRLHGLWYNPILPVLFFIQAVGVGLAMVIFISHLSSRAFGKKLDYSLIINIARVFVLVEIVYLMVRFESMAFAGSLSLAFQPGMESTMFWLEIAIGSVIPATMLAIPVLRHSRGGLFYASVLAVGGFAMARLNVAVTGFVQSSGYSYFPNWEEVISAMFIVAVGFKIWELAGRNLPIMGSMETLPVEISSSEPVFVDITPEYS